MQYSSLERTGREARLRWKNVRWIKREVTGMNRAFSVTLLITAALAFGQPPAGRGGRGPGLRSGVFRSRPFPMRKPFGHAKAWRR